jgi:hypothetical protein
LVRKEILERREIIRETIGEESFLFQLCECVHETQLEIRFAENLRPGEVPGSAVQRGLVRDVLAALGPLIVGLPFADADFHAIVVQRG